MIAERLHEVEAEIEKARLRRTQVPKDAPVRLVAVTKNHDVAAMREAIDAGVQEIGENRIQESKSKFDVLDRKVKWHLIGHLQTNKAKHAVKYFDLIHSIDSEHLAVAVNHAAASIDKIQDVLVQVNLAEEASKSGIHEDGLMDLLKAVDSLENLRLRGLMLIAPNYEDVEECRPLFRNMYGIFQRIRGMEWKRAKIEYLSMGMTHDYRIAVEEGANIVRVGTAIFGQRQY
ncbi:MAG: YggS family pyridoxal phosphate-dependent enzyme [Selenomonadaceae bacterium]|nr:YggS family pyridoxal phosphate-dependent enzyme [Selenomonadaceae bacterium]